MLTRLPDQVWWIPLTGVNAYLVKQGEELTLVDTGLPLHADRIERAIVAVGESFGAIDRVLLTHYDVDHVGGLGRLSSIDAPVYVGSADRPYVVGNRKPCIHSQKGLFQRAVHWWCTPPTQQVIPVDDGDTVGDFTAYSAPGHTPGHTVFANESIGVAFLGDLVIEWKGAFRPAPWFICEDHDRLKADILDLVERLPRFSIGCPGHGVPFVEGGDERLADCASRIRNSVEVKSTG